MRLAQGPGPFDMGRPTRTHAHREREHGAQLTVPRSDMNDTSGSDEAALITAIQDSLRHVTDISLPDDIQFRLAEACLNARTVETGNAALARFGGKVIFFDMPRAILACAGTLAAASIAVAQPTLAAAMATLGAICNFRGATTTLTSSQGLVCSLLVDVSQSFALTKPELLKRFYVAAADQGIQTSETHFAETLTALTNLGCIVEEDEIISLRQQIVLGM